MQSDHPPRTFLYGQRMSWAQAPAEVTAWVEARLGSRVVRWSDRLGGMSTGMACVVSADDGRSLFVKAVNGSENSFALQLLIREAELSVQLPALPGVPRVLDAGEVTVEEDVWWAVITPAVPGHAVRHPWRAPDLARVLDAWDRVAVVLSGTPWALTSRPPPFFTAWSALAADHADPWQPLVTSWLDREARLIDVSSGSAHDPPVLSHLDLRADNIVLTDAPADQEVWFVDWAHPGLAACWVDLALLLADVVGSGADASTGGADRRDGRLASASDRLPVRPRAVDLRGVGPGCGASPAGPETCRSPAAAPEPLGGGDVGADGAVRAPAHHRGAVVGRARDYDRTSARPGSDRICATSARNLDPC